MNSKRIQRLMMILAIPTFYAWSATSQRELNQFDCASPSRDLKVSYSKTSFAGIPLLSVTKKSGKTFSAQTESIKVYKKEKKPFVSGKLENGQNVSLLLKNGKSKIELWSKDKRESHPVECKGQNVVF